MDLLDILDLIDLLAKLRNQTVKKFFLWIIWFLLVSATLFILYKLILTTVGVALLNSTTVYETEVSKVASPNVDFDSGEIEKPPYDVKYEALSREEKEFFDTIKNKKDSAMTVGEETFETETIPPSLFTNGVTVCDDCGVGGDFEFPEEGFESGTLSTYGYYNINSSQEPIEKGFSANPSNATTYLILFLLFLVVNTVFYIKSDFSILGILSTPFNLLS